MHSYFDFSSRKQRVPLSDEQVQVITRCQVEQVSSDYCTRAEGIDVLQDIDHLNVRSLSQKRFLAHLERWLKAGGIRTAANIGARVDIYCAYLAHKFPQTEFFSLDFQPNLALHNSPFPQSPNWQFKTGYPLQLIRDGAVKADLYFFVSASVLMNNTELNAYLDEISKHASAIAFCEGWWPRAETLTFRVERPEQIPKENPYCGGDYANYHHNYIAKLEERGYRIELCRIVPESTSYHYLQLFAVKR